MKAIGYICAGNSHLKTPTHKQVSKFFKQRKTLMRKRTMLRKRLYSNHDGGKIYQKINEIELELLKSHTDERIYEESRAVDRIKSDPDYFFKYAKKFSNSNSGVGPLMNSAGDLITDGKEMCEILLQQFSRVFSKPKPSRVVMDPTSFFDPLKAPQNTPLLTNIKFTKELVETAINSLKTTSAPGPDGLNCEILKKCVSTISEPIAVLFTQSLEEGSVPELCKRAAVVPIYKGGDRSDPSNYRPIY